MKENLYVFQWISDLGGADTRLKELLILLKDSYNITLIPNDDFRLNEKHNTDFLDNLKIKYHSASELPDKLHGYAYANCNFRIFSDKHRINKIKDSGLKFLWSNDMMWHTPEELAAVKNNQIDVALYTSVFHKNIINAEVMKQNPYQKTFVIENYFDSDTWPLLLRSKRPYTVFGKHSRDDLLKFSENFPVFYEQVTNGLESSFSVLGWSDQLDQKYSWHTFDARWRMYATNAMPTIQWLADLDVFLYNCNHKFIENQSRSVIEAQLTGCPIIAPRKWNFPNMIPYPHGGCCYDSIEEAREYATSMCDFNIRTKAGKIASEATREEWCNKEKSINKWNSLINLANQKIEVSI
jgi:hypothetical protein